MPKLLIASGNPGKLKEIHNLLNNVPVELLTPTDLNLDLEVTETGTSYAENAQLKAMNYAQASGLWTLADDTGLEVDALEGGPGLKSARIAGPGQSDADRRKVLLNLLRPFARPWSARFRCIAVLMDPTGTTDFTEGVCEGEIITQERGDSGFGYDPIFLLPIGKTMAELTLSEKNELSHRGKAIQAMIPILVRRLGLNKLGIN
ncbi:MAG: RdgB/HAM1 family non-canonical purine NTP pyrophosphatase [Anaerolineales bacterium]|nr:RdgB/HAM1 family non-canonical purine NTP pyrophosphatase [Anaerolineales bacterium]